MKELGALVAVVAAAALVAALMRSGAETGAGDPVATSPSRLVPGRAAASASPRPGRRLTRVVEGVRFSFRLYGCCWEPGPIARVPALGGFRDRRLFISKSATGPQGAEAILFWTSFPNAANTDACANLLRAPIGPSASDLVAAMGRRTPGVVLTDAPVKAAVGGHPAAHASLRVILDLGCDPGFFFTWRPRGPGDAGCWGACWLESREGDSIRVWVVEIRGKRLVFQAETSEDVDPDVHRQIRLMVQSIRFHG